MKAKKTFIFKEPKKTHTIKLKHRNYWWLLLFLLLFLLLLRFNTTIEYELKSPCPIENINGLIINIDYEDYNGIVQKKQSNFNSENKAKFKIKGKRLYEMLFNKNKIGEINANVLSEEILLISHNDFFKNLKNKITFLEIDSKEEYIFTTISKQNKKFKIKNATIELEYLLNDKKFTTKCKTDSLGCCSFNIPVCAINIKLKGDKRNYLPDSIIGSLPLAFNNDNNRILELTPKIYDLDIIMCIDATGSMNNIIGEVKDKSKSLYADLKERMIIYDKYTDNIRIKTISYKNGCNGLIEGVFCEIPDKKSEYNKQVENIRVSGGHESGLEALSLAFTSEFLSKGEFNRQIIVLITDYNAFELNGCSDFPIRIPSNFNGLTQLWNTIKPTASLVVMAPEGSWWIKINNEWENVFTIFNNGKVTKSDYSLALDQIAKAI